MIKILLSGCNGTMGKVIAKCIEEREDCTIVAGLDVNTAPNGVFPVFGNAEDINVDCDVIIDFSHPSALSGVLKYALKTKTPAVIATTGLSEEQINSLQLASSQIPVFFSANMSIGVSLVSELVKKAASVLGGSFDIEIVEAHHNKKIDAPSGTARSLADIVDGNMDVKTDIQSVRCGEISGIHTIGFEGLNDRITMTHEAFSREGFAAGAVEAALRTEGLQGVHEFKELFFE